MPSLKKRKRVGFLDLEEVPRTFYEKKKVKVSSMTKPLANNFGLLFIPLHLFDPHMRHPRQYLGLQSKFQFVTNRESTYPPLIFCLFLSLS